MPVKPGLKVTVLRRGGQDRDTLVEAVVRAVVGEIVSTRLANTLRITVECRATKLRRDVCGTAKYEVQPDPRMKEYRIIVDRDMDTLTLVQTVAHEVRHIEQYARGRLRCGKQDGVRGHFWRDGAGPAVFCALASYSGTDPLLKSIAHNTYLSRPWEIEARATECIGEQVLRQIERNEIARSVRRCVA